MKPGPQSETWRAGRYRLPQRPARVNEWMVGFGVVIMLVVVAVVVVAIAVEAMQVRPK